MEGETGEHRKARVIEEENWRLTYRNSKQISSSDISIDMLTEN